MSTKKSDGRQRRRCPACGVPVLVSNVRAHIGSERCLVDVTRRGGDPFDSDRGPLALHLARALVALLR